MKSTAALFFSLVALAGTGYLFWKAYQIKKSMAFAVNVGDDIDEAWSKFKNAFTSTSDDPNQETVHEDSETTWSEDEIIN